MYKYKLLLIVVFVINANIANSTPIFYEHYLHIISDTLLKEGFVEIIKYPSIKAQVKEKGQIVLLRQYKDGKLILKKEQLSTKFYYIYYYEYAADGKLLREHKYNSSGSLEYSVDYIFEEQVLKYSLSKTKYYTYKVVYSFNEKGKITEETQYTSGYRYSKRLTTYLEDSLVNKVVISIQDTATAFKKTRIIAQEITDKKTGVEFFETYHEKESVYSIEKNDPWGRITSLIICGKSPEEGEFYTSSSFSYQERGDCPNCFTETSNTFIKGKDILSIRVTRPATRKYILPDFRNKK